MSIATGRPQTIPTATKSPQTIATATRSPQTFPTVTRSPQTFPTATIFPEFSSDHPYCQNMSSDYPYYHKQSSNLPYCHKISSDHPYCQKMSSDYPYYHKKSSNHRILLQQEVLKPLNPTATRSPQTIPTSTSQTSYFHMKSSHLINENYLWNITTALPDLNLPYDKYYRQLRQNSGKYSARACRPACRSPPQLYHPFVDPICSFVTSQLKAARKHTSQPDYLKILSQLVHELAG